MGMNLINQPLDLLFNEFAVNVGLIYGYLPFAVLPMYASIEKFDHSLMEAAADLGAPPWRAFLRVMLPMTLPGVIAALVLVFVPVVGAFITPDIMGGGKIEMIGTLINRQFGVSRNWPFGASMSLILMLLGVDRCDCLLPLEQRDSGGQCDRRSAVFPAYPRQRFVSTRMVTGS
jgi:spermidine/putrescine transport system permease protein